jgi:soluble lytic murein transglycosylase-like protein
MIVKECLEYQIKITKNELAEMEKRLVQIKEERDYLAELIRNFEAELALFGRGTMESITALILAIALEVGVPPYFALAIALTENQTLNPLAVHVNADGTKDQGIMQLNSSWFNGNWQDPETNIRAGCKHLKWLMDQPEVTTLWAVAVAYNSGFVRFKEGPPAASVIYANEVFAKYNEFRGYKW